MTGPALHDLLTRNLEHRADHPALVEGTRILTYRELDRQSGRVAAWLTGVGVAAGDRVAIQLPNEFEAVVAILAAARIGAVFAPLHLAFKAPQLAPMMRDLEAAVLVTDARRARALVTHGIPPGLRRILVTGEGLEAEPASPWPGSDAGSPPPPAEISGPDLAAIFYTSGSTGWPKGVMHTHRGLRTCASTLAGSVGNRPEDRLMGHLPLSASYGLVQLLTAFEVGATVVLHRAPFVTEIVATLVRQRVTGFGNTTHSWLEIVRHLAENPTAFPDLRTITIAGTAFPTEVLEALPRMLPGVEILQCYGLTEAFRVASVPPELYGEKRGALGMPLPGVDAFVVDAERGLLGPGEPGELLVRSDFMTTGYWNAPEATDGILKPSRHLAGLVDAGKVLHTGDVVRSDEDGCLWFLGRKDARFKVADYRVSPEEIEEALTSSGLVAHAVAYGVADERRGTVVHAVAFARNDRPVAVAELLRHCRRKLPAHLVPVEIHVREDEMPIIGPGKPDRGSILAAMGRDGMDR